MAERATVAHTEEPADGDAGRGWLGDVDERTLVADLTLGVLSDAAREEVALFVAHRAHFLEEPGATEGPGQEVTFGAESALTPLAVIAAKTAVRVIAGALAEAVQAQAGSIITDWLRQLILRGPTRPAPLPPELVERVRNVTYLACRQAGASEADAALVSDAVAGRLATT